MTPHLTRTWRTVRCGAGMTILSVVFVVSQSLVLVHELVHRMPAAPERG